MGTGPATTTQASDDTQQSPINVRASSNVSYYRRSCCRRCVTDATPPKQGLASRSSRGALTSPSSKKGVTTKSAQDPAVIFDRCATQVVRNSAPVRKRVAIASCKDPTCVLQFESLHDATASVFYWAGFVTTRVPRRSQITARPSPDAVVTRLFEGGEV